MTRVADLGNTRIKWGLCNSGRVERTASLAPDNPDAWRVQLAAWKVDGPQKWTLAGVHPARRDQFAEWLRWRGDDVRILLHFSQLPIPVNVPAPEKVGIDRILNVLAAKALVPPGTPAIVVDAGSAVTVDVLDETGAFAGGAIFPGYRLMAEALHAYTALLPLVNAKAHPTVAPAGTTATAIAAGIHWAVVGGVHALIRTTSLQVPSPEPLPVFLTGGDAEAIRPDLPDADIFRYELRPTLTLEGIASV
jgi:type III pantothenate kinase